MALVANNPKAAKRIGIPKSVGEDFMKADKGKKFAKGGMSLFKGKETKAEEMKEAKAVKSGKLSPAQYAKGEAKEGHGKGALAKGKALKTGKLSAKTYASEHEGMKKGGKVKKMAFGGSAGKLSAMAAGMKNLAKNVAASRGKIKNYAEGGAVASGKKPAESDYDKRLREEALQEMRDKKMRDQMGKAYDKAREQSLGTPEKKMRSGGSCGMKKYARGGGIEVRGKTRGKII